MVFQSQPRTRSEGFLNVGFLTTSNKDTDIFVFFSKPAKESEDVFSLSAFVKSIEQ